MNILFVLAIILMFIVFVFFSYPRLVLLYIKSTKGRYSPAYFAQFKKYFNKNPYGYCIKEDFIDRILPFIQRNEKASVIRISHNKLPLKYPWFISFKKLKEKEGKPLCFQAYQKYNMDFKIIGYSSSIHGTKAKTFYYFADRLLFMTEYVISNKTAAKAGEILSFLSDDTFIDNGSFKYLYMDTDKGESLFARDAAFSMVIACLNSDHPHIRKCLDRINEEHKKLWNIYSSKYKKGP